MYVLGARGGASHPCGSVCRGGEDPQLSTKDPWRKRRSGGTMFRCPFVVLGGWSDPYAIYYFQWSFPLLDHVAHDAADRCAVHANETEHRDLP